MTRRSRAIAVAGLIVIAATTAAAMSQDIFGLRGGSSNDYGNLQYDDRLTFVRIRYTSGLGAFNRRGSRGELPWAHDYPTADIHLMKIVKELTMVAPHIDGSNVLTLDDPELFNHPIAYMSEPGFWTASDKEIAGLRNYLLKGGFIIFDDFRGADWNNLEQQMRRAMPEGRWIALDLKHQIFNSFFEIKNFSFGQYGQETYYGMFEDNDPTKRMFAIAGHNQDLGEFWEYSDTGYLPIDLSNEAYKYGVNFYMYALTH
jgi:hypothetical protein